MFPVAIHYQPFECRTNGQKALDFRVPAQYFSVLWQANPERL